MKKCLTILMLSLIISMIISGCGNEKQAEKIDPSTVSKTALESGSDLSKLKEGKYYEFDAVFWTTTSNKKYPYAFSCYLNGEEYAKAFHVQDSTGGHMAFLKKYSYTDKKRVNMIAEYIESEDTGKQIIYKFKCIEITECDNEVSKNESVIEESKTNSEEMEGNQIESETIEQSVDYIEQSLSSEAETETATNSDLQETEQGVLSGNTVFEGAYLLEAQSEGYGIIEEVYIPNYDGISYYVVFAKVDENGNEHSVSGFLNDTEDINSSFYTFWDEEHDNLEFAIVVLEQGHIKLSCFEALSDEESYLGMSFDNTTWQRFGDSSELLN